MNFFIHSFWIACLSTDSFKHCSNLSLRLIERLLEGVYLLVIIEIVKGTLEKSAESPDEVLLEITPSFRTFGRCSFEPSISDSFQSYMEYLYKGRLLCVEYARDFKHITDVFDSTIGESSFCDVRVKSKVEFSKGIEPVTGKNYVRKFLRALHPKWRAKVTAIEESKEFTSLSLDELIRNLKDHEMIIKIDSKIVKAKGERKSIVLKAKKESSDEECSTFGREDEEHAMEVRDFKKFFKRRGRFMRQPRNDKKTLQRSRDDKNGKSSWSDRDKEDDEKDKDKTCLVAQASSEIYSESSYCSNENSSIDDSYFR
ncbi:hypothetical protein Tco_0059756 [Tanacetum coccineum]